VPPVAADNHPPLDLNDAKFSMQTPRVWLWRDPQHQDLFVIGNDGRVWTTYWVLGDRDWHPWFPITDASQARDQAHPRHPDQALFQ
jgi:hypothetical protein